MFAVDEDQDEVEEAGESFLEMGELFYLKSGGKSKKKSKDSGGAK